MNSSLSPSEALSPEAFYSLYLGGLALENERERLDACYTLLLLGRLGLQPDEIAHLHEGWLDWERGEIHVPAHDPCACSACWGRARTRQAQGDDRYLSDIVVSDCWSPPGEGQPRRLAFGWSQRLTATLDGLLSERPYFDVDRSALELVIRTAARKSEHLEPTAVSISSLRASAVTFLATAGFGPRRLADLCGIDEETAGAFARVGGGEMGDHLYRVLGDVDVPDICRDGTSYRLVCNPEQFDGEPFDPMEYGPQWRAQRDAQSPSRERNPRPVELPADVSFDPEDQLGVSEPAGESGPGIVADSLSEWVRQHDRQRGEPTPDETPPGREHADERADRRAGTAERVDQTTDAERVDERAPAADRTHETPGQSEREQSGTDTRVDTSTAQRDAGQAADDSDATTADSAEPADATTADSAEPDDAATDPRDQVTEPVEFSLDTRFAATGFENARPTGGSVLLGQEELLLLSRDASGISSSLRVDLDWIANVSPGYASEQLDRVFEDTVGLAYYDEDDERRIAVIELPSEVRWDAIRMIFIGLLDDYPAVVAHRPKETGRESERRQLDVEPEKLGFIYPRDERPSLTIRLSMLVDFEVGKMDSEIGYERGLTIRHLKTSGDVVRTEVRPTSETKLKLLGQYLKQYHDRQRQRVRDAALNEVERDVLDGLYTADSQQDMFSILDTDPETLSTALTRLGRVGLLRDTNSGARLTGAGYLFASDEFDIV
jgi:helix-turn-helix protein